MRTFISYPILPGVDYRSSVMLDIPNALQISDISSFRPPVILRSLGTATRISASTSMTRTLVDENMMMTQRPCVEGFMASLLFHVGNAEATSKSRPSAETNQAHLILGGYHLNLEPRAKGSSQTPSMVSSLRYHKLTPVDICTKVMSSQNGGDS